MEDVGFCITCQQDVPVAGCRTIRETAQTALIIGADRRAHSLVFGKVAQRFRAGRTQESFEELTVETELANAAEPVDQGETDV